MTATLGHTATDAPAGEPDYRGVLALFPPTQGLLGRPNPAGRTRWGTRFGYFGTDRILRTYLAATEILALRFIGRTRFGALDLDVGSPYHTLPTVAGLFSAAAALNLQLTLCRSSESGGWHVYLWAAEAIPSAVMHAALRSLAEAAGICRFENGVCEVYPDPNHAKQPFRLPAQPGFAWLSPVDAAVVRACESRAGPSNLAALAEWACTVAVPGDRFSGAASESTARRNAAVMPRGRPPKIAPPPRASDGLPAAADLCLQRGLVYRYDRNAARGGRPDFAAAAMHRFHEGERLFSVGLERPGSRNAALQLVSFYLFFCGYTKAADRELLLLLWLSARHNGQSAAWLAAESGNEIEQEIARLAAWQPLGRGVAAAAAQTNARQRRMTELALTAAAATMADAGDTPSIRKLAASTGLSVQAVAANWPRVRRKIIGVIMPPNGMLPMPNLET